MEAEEFVQLWHASFGPETQPPESGCKTAQDVGTELRACETRVEALQTLLKRELRVLEWLRKVVVRLERRSREGDSGDRETYRPLEGEESAHSSPDLRACESKESSENSSNSAYPARSRTHSPADSEYFSPAPQPLPAPEDSSTSPTPEEVHTGEALVGKLDIDHEVEEKKAKKTVEFVFRERFVHKVNSKAKGVGGKRLIEQEQWWSSNLVTLEHSARERTPVSRRHSVSDPSSLCHIVVSTIPSVKVHTPVEGVSAVSRELDTAEAEEEKVEEHCCDNNSSTVFETDRRAVSEVEEKTLVAEKPEEYSTREGVGNPEEHRAQPTVRRTHSHRSSGNAVFQERFVHSTNSLGRRQGGSTLSLPEEVGSVSTTLKRRKSTIEAKLAERRRAGGWKVIEVGGQRRLTKYQSGARAELNTSRKITNTERKRTSLSENNVFEREGKLNPCKMLKAAREKLSRVTSSPPLRRRPSRESNMRRGRDGSMHRSSNGQVESASSGAVVEEVVVERKVERSESLLSEIMAHRFSNGLEGAKLFDSGEHSLVSNQESGGEATSAPVPSADNTPKVILRRRSGRDMDPLPEAKRRSSCLEEDDCSTPKEDYSLSLSEDTMHQGLTKSVAESAALKKSQLERLGSDTTLRQESLEATLTPNSLPGGATDLPGNVNYRMSYMTAVHDSPQMNFTTAVRENQVDYMPLIDEREGELPASGRLQVVSSEPNLLELDPTTVLEDSMELDEATISAVTLNNDMFGSRSGSVTSLPETLEDSQSTSATSLSEAFSSPTHAPVVNLRQSDSSGGRSGGGRRRRNRKRMGNAELDDQTGASLDEMLSSESVLSPMSSHSSSSSMSMMTEEVCIPMIQSPTTTPTLLSPPPHHPPHLEVHPHLEVESPGSTRSSRIYPVRRSTVVVQGEKLVIRKLVVAGIVSAEKSYLDCLNVMKEFYRKPLLALTTTTQPILTEREINTIFYRTEDLAILHTTLHEKLEPQLRDWSVNTCVGDFFVELCKNLKLYKDYVEFYRQSLQCLEKLKSESIPFKTFLENVRATVTTHYKDVPRVNELLRRPIERLQSYSLILNDLCQHTPEEHKDYSVLRQSLHAMSAFIASTHDPQSFSKLSGGYNRELVKEGLMVELSEGIRKVRRVFLFHDVIVSSKQKPTRAGMKFEPKWFLPLSELTFHSPEGSPEANRPVPATSDMDLAVMRNRIAELKAQIGRENTRDRSGSQPEREGSFRKGRGGIRAIYTMKSSRIERTRKKLQEQQVSYWMAVPSLPLRLYGDTGKQQYVFLLHSEQERENWIASIKKLQPKAVRSVSFHPLELQDLLNHQTITELKKIEEVTLPVLEDEYLSGMLRVRIMSATDIKAKPGGIYCAVELDEYGKFERKAKTLPVPTDPTTLAVTWDQDFELEVAGAHIVKVNICTKQLLKEESYAHGKIRLPIHELRSNKRHKTDIKLYPQGSLQIIIEYIASGSRDRRPALLSSGVFGVPIDVVAKRERHDIPLIVETCVEEVERRGMSEVGIYRVAGVLRDVRELRDAFDTDYLKAQVIAFEADIHAVAGLLKKYFRELPDPLFTGALYLNFVQGMGLSDPEARDQCLITLLYSLPPVNFKTAIFLFKHLRKIAANSELNKMNLNNLATLFGPNLLRPAPIGQEESLLNMAAVDVATPVNVLMFFLRCPEEFLEEAQLHTSPASTASTGRGKRRDSRKKLMWIEEEDGMRSVRSSRRSSGRNSQT